MEEDIEIPNDINDEQGIIFANYDLITGDQPKKGKKRKVKFHHIKAHVNPLSDLHFEK
jgi:hypothetical protein